MSGNAYDRAQELISEEGTLSPTMPRMEVVPGVLLSPVCHNCPYYADTGLKICSHDQGS